MRPQHCSLLTIISTTLTLCATSAFALPTDKGRSADLYQNAARYFVAVPFTPDVQPLVRLEITPKLQPEGLVPEGAEISPDAQIEAVALAPATSAFDTSVEASEDDIDADALMAQMAEDNADLQIRDGGEDGPDTMMMSSDVLFSFGKAELAPEAIATLASIGETFAAAGVIEVLGHTDAIGSEANNLALGQQRAEAVRAWLLSNSNIPAERVIATGVGEGDPVAPNTTDAGQDNPNGRAQNRRVEFAFR